MRCLAIDLGDKRTGLAVGDTITRIASPLDVLEVPIAERQGEALLDAIVKAIDHQVSPQALCTLIIGLPLNMDGTEGPRSAHVRAFADRLSQRLASTLRPIVFQDERLTSADADWQMARSGLTHKGKKQRRDALAAAIILREYLEGEGPRG